jgi:hypothetical protein
MERAAVTDKPAVYHACEWPQCQRRLKYGTWCDRHFYKIPTEYKIGTRTEPQPPELVRAVKSWIARSMAVQCSRCASIVEPGAIKVRLNWPWSLANDLVLELCSACAESLEDAIGIRWCETCSLWTRKTHPIHTRHLRVVPRE